MNIFEDLIEELKEENLLEETVVDFRQEKNAVANRPVVQSGATDFQTRSAAAKESFPPPAPPPSAKNSGVLPIEFRAHEDVYTADEFVQLREPTIPESRAESEVSSEPESVIKYPKVERARIYVSEKEYFRKRAMDEVTGLQMVDHVLSGVEREQMKLIPKPYDDLPVKLALHDFLQLAHNTNTTEHAQSEFRLMQETENWCSALAHRDKHITIAHLRRYCETTRPALSPQALISLARFYRNSPYCEPIRNKFELVVTRLFSRVDQFEVRELLLSREEMIDQLKVLYAEWSSIQLYSTDDADSEILITILKFEDFVNEAEETSTFEELISCDFFNRLRLFKQNCNENFFSPVVTAAAVEANVKINNRYLHLLQKEKEKFNAAAIEEKYGFLHDQAISDATGRTFQLAELLHERSEIAAKELTEIADEAVKDLERSGSALAPPKKPRSKLYAVNKWLLAATILTVVACVGLFIWSETESQELKRSPNIKRVNLVNSEFKDFIQIGRIDNDSFYGITTAAWESLNREKKEELLKKLLSVGVEKNYQKVHLISNGGRAVGFASPDKVEVYNQ